jgi:hypothetical protein
MSKIKLKNIPPWKGHALKWRDIKHLELKDDIHAAWVDDDNFDYQGYWLGNITRMVEESDEQYEKRIQRAKISVAELKKRRYENYLKLKKEFENDKKRSKSDPRKKKQMRATFLVTLFQVHYMEQFHQFLQCKQLKYGVLQSK